ncbi:MAG TPA: MFS transporter [Thermomicrobiales bacterium]|nr:MFS transporter [Thermomicrobiales bacterium]
MASNRAGGQPERTFWLLVAAIFTVAVNSQVMNPVLPAVAEDFDASVSGAGLAVTAYLLPYGALQLLYGPLADRVGRVQVIVVALGAAALGTLLCAIAPSLNLLIAFRFLTGGTAAAVIPLTFTYIGDTIEYSRRQAAIGYTAMSLSLGNVLAGALGGFLAAFVSWRAIFIIIAAISGAVVLLILREPNARQRPAATPRSFLEPIRSAIEDRRHIGYYLMIVVEGTIVLGAFSYFGLILRDRDEFSYAAIGVIISLYGLTSVLAGRLLGSLAARLGERRMILFGGALVSIALALMLAPPLPFFPLAMITAGFGYVVMHTTFQTRATELVPSARATGVAIFAFSLFMGGSLGSFVIAQGFDRIGFNPTLIGVLGVTVAFVLFAAWAILPLTQPHQAAAREGAAPDRRVGGGSAGALRK